MRASTILTMIIIMDLFAFFGVIMVNDLQGNTSFEEIALDGRPTTAMWEYDSDEGELNDSYDAGWFDTALDFGGDVTIAVLASTGLENLAREVQAAINLFISMLTAPFVLGELIGGSEIWFVGTAIPLLYMFLMAMALISLWKGGAV